MGHVDVTWTFSRDDSFPTLFACPVPYNISRVPFNLYSLSHRFLLLLLLFDPLRIATWPCCSRYLLSHRALFVDFPSFFIPSHIISASFGHLSSSLFVCLFVSYSICHIYTLFLTNQYTCLINTFKVCSWISSFSDCRNVLVCWRPLVVDKSIITANGQFCWAEFYTIFLYLV